MHAQQCDSINSDKTGHFPSMIVIIIATFHPAYMVLCDLYHNTKCLVFENMSWCMCNGVSCLGLTTFSEIFSSFIKIHNGIFSERE